MSTPEPTPVHFDTEPAPDFGPDPSMTPNLDGLNIPKVNKANPPRASKSIFNKVGQNKKARSGIRKLNAEDRDKLASLYTFGAMGLMPFRPKAAQAMAVGADGCADAWMELADQHDGVRRTLLFLIEGGAWGKVFAAHTPILLALLPEGMVPPMFQGFDAANIPTEETGE